MIGEENPQGIKLKKPLPDGIKKLNSKPFLFLGAITIIVILSIIYAMSQRGVKKDSNETAKHEDVIEAVNDDSVGNIIKNANQASADENKSSAPLVVNGSNMNDYNVTMPQQKNTPLDDAAQKAAADQLQRSIDAKNSPTALDNTKSQTNNQNAEIGNILANVMNPNQNQNQGVNSLAEILAAQNPQKSNINQDSNSFMKSTQASYDYLPYKKTPQISKYELKTGSVIPGVMISGINSELPGMLIGQVSQNVYDSATGHYLLIPQGSRLVGQYSANVQYGQSRVLIAWNRIIFPDGQSLNIGAMNGTDQAGYAGFEDKVNNHYMRIFGSALLISVIGGEFSFSNGHIAINQQAQSANSGTTISQVGNTMLEKNLAVSPTIEIRPGYQFNIFVTKDMQLENLPKFKG
ncbi:MAG: hypothetical protein JXQ77_06080 [Campylobacterales bacterium]|nr:hypothetical protein [Campylobacterales bacterium]